MTSFGECSVLDILKDGRMVEDGLYEVELERGFDEAVFSWNMVLDKGEKTEVFFRIRAEGQWSRQYKLADWPTEKCSWNRLIQKDAFGTLDVDVFRPLSNVAVDAIRIRITRAGSVEDVLNGLYVSLKRGLDRNAEIVHAFTECYVPVPAIVQTPVPDIGCCISSPACCAMLLGTIGVAVDPEAVAELAWDGSRDVYGNLSMNTAAAGQLGACAYVRHFNSMKDLNILVGGGCAVAVSVKTPEKEGFDGALRNYPSGHLIVVNGFEKKGGEWYVSVVDPADDSSVSAMRLYKQEEFDRYWTGVGYVVEPQESDKMDVFDTIDRWIPDAIIDLKYATTDNFTGQVIYRKPYDKLRLGTLKKLSRAARILRKQGYRLVVWDALRPRFAQKILWDIVQEERFVANPDKGSKHNRGCAVDVSLADENGVLLEMPTTFDDFSEAARAFREDLELEILRRVKTLQIAMIDSGFLINPSEWWHFNDSDWSCYPLVE